MKVDDDPEKSYLSPIEINLTHNHPAEVVVKDLVGLTFKQKLHELNCLIDNSTGHSIVELLFDLIQFMLEKAEDFSYDEELNVKS